MLPLREGKKAGVDPWERERERERERKRERETEREIERERATNSVMKADNVILKTVGNKVILTVRLLTYVSV
jgi:hypothetical protein